MATRRQSDEITVSKAAMRAILNQLCEVLQLMDGTNGSHTRCGLSTQKADAMRDLIERLRESAPRGSRKQSAKGKKR